jgi:glycosyltransferase involved in cell wall biosynthesis
MKIAQIAPIIEKVPPEKYGGTERMVHTLTEELVKRGHEVTLFAAGGSRTSAKLYPILPTTIRNMKVENLYGENWARLLGAGLPYQLQHKFDIIHDHNEPLSVPIANLSQTPVVMTLHGIVDAGKQQLFEKLTHPYLVSISKAQVLSKVNINHIETIYHGFDMQNYPFSDTPRNYLLYVGRMSPEKGLHNAIAVAQKLNKQLVIAAKLDEKDMPYFKKKIEPHLSDKIVWIGEVKEEERNTLMSKALCFLHPAEWDEPFGLTLIEAQACGAPVIAFDKGSIPEIIKHGQTGFVVKSVEEMVTAIKHIKNIDRKKCRRHVLDKFNAKRMADEYELIYETILEKRYQEKNHFSTHYSTSPMIYPQLLEGREYERSA